MPECCATESCPVVSIVSIRGRATGVAASLRWPSDMRFASREGQFCHSGGALDWSRAVPHGQAARLIGRGRALEVLLVRIYRATRVELSAVPAD